MPSKDIIALLGGWEGYRIGTVARFEAGELSEKSRTPEVLIDLVRRPGRMICSGCGQGDRPLELKAIHVGGHD